MSPFCGGFGLLRDGFPRVSGDEPPRAFSTPITRAFSPRERG